jgi:cell division protein FtsN
MAAKRSKHQARRNGGKGVPGWIWWLIGVLLIALAASAWLLRDRWRQTGSLLPQPDPNAQAPASSDDTVADDAAPDKPKPKYDFFEILPNKEVVIPDAELAEQAQAETKRQEAAAQQAAPTPANSGDFVATTPAAANAADNRYVLQAGAFRGLDDAEALKAKIALTGEVARVETAEINGNTVYRVRMGPYATASSLAAAKQALASHGIDGAQAIRVK